MENLTIKEIKSFKDALALRKIRNQCREFMTRNKNSISYLKQFEWFYSIYMTSSSDELFAFLLMLDDKAIGYGLIRDRASRPLISGGLAKEYRGKGYGEKLFKIVTDMASRTSSGKGTRSVFLEVLTTNTAAIKLYEKLGFVTKVSSQEILYMQKDYGEFD